MPRELHIASCVIHARPTALADLAGELAALPGAEVQAAAASGKLVVTLESSSDSGILDLIGAIRDPPGVLSAAPVFHHVEPLSHVVEPLPCS